MSFSKESNITIDQNQINVFQQEMFEYFNNELRKIEENLKNLYTTSKEAKDFKELEVSTREKVIINNTYGFLIVYRFLCSPYEKHI